MKLTEHRSRAQGLPDLLLYDALVDDGILLLQDGSLLAAWSYRGPDMQSSTHDEMAILSSQLNGLLRLGSGWLIHCDAIRSLAPGYPKEGAFPDSITRLIDDERRMQFMAEEAHQAHFESEYFIALTYQCPIEVEERIRGWMFEGELKKKPSAQKAIEYFRSRIAAFEDRFSSILKIERLQLRTVTDEFGYAPVQDDLLRYIRRCITGDDHAFVLTSIPACLNDIIGCVDFMAGIEPQVGRKHLRVIAIDGFPRMSSPGMLRALDTLGIEYRWNNRALLLDSEEAHMRLDKIRKKWRGKMRGWKDQLMRTQNGVVNLFAQEMSLDAEEAIAVASSGDVQFAYYSSNILCMDEDVQRLDNSVGLVVKTIQNLGFGCRVESVNAVEAYRGSLPGDGYRNVRRTLVHTLNLADFFPITAIWAGSRQNPSPLMPPGSPALLYAATTGATPFRFNLHVADLGHALICGPPGAGKSTFLALVVAQWFRYPNARVFGFDKGYSLYALTSAAGGEFYDIGGEKSALSFCPLHELDSDADVAWAVSWLEGLCVAQGLRVAPRERNALTDAVRLLQASPTRTLTELSANVQDESVREALLYYTLGGPLGHLLDADEDMLGDGRFITFETENLMGLGEKAVAAVLMYLFRRIEKRLERGGGAPTLIPLDEAWVFLKNELFRERIREWLKTVRKLNAVVLLATQNLSDVFHSPIRDVILEACPTKILLPNPEAGNPASRSLYEQLGLNQTEIDIVQTSLPKRQYYIASPMGRRLIGLGMGPVALSFAGVNGREERTRLEELINRTGETWPAEWLRSRGLDDWARYLEELNQRRSKCSESTLVTG
jgi:type IV secretion system protein VirB4